MALSIFRLTDGTETINLLSNELDGFYLREYAPILSQYKDGGLFQDSPLADNRRPVYTRRNTVVQPVVLDAKAVSHDSMARMLQDLVRLLEKAKDYWVSDWQNTPVWLEAKTAKETNTRYALVYMGRVEDYPPPYQQPFSQEGGTPVATEMTLFLEIGQWLDVGPTVGGGSSLEAIGATYYRSDMFITVNASSAGGTTFTIPDNAVVQDLPDGASGFTFEFWMKTDAERFSYSMQFDKTGGGSVGWKATLIIGDGSSSGNNCRMDVWKTGPVDVSGIWTLGNNPAMYDTIFDGDWHHYMFSFNKNAADDTCRFWIDGVEQSATKTGWGSGTYASDVGNDLIGGAIGSVPVPSVRNFSFGWMRISDVQRETSASFTPEPLCLAPEIDANTVVQYNMDDGHGLELVNKEGTAAVNCDLLSSSFVEWGFFPESVCPTSPLVGATVATTSEVFAANKFCLQGLTNAHITNTGSNLIGSSWPADIFSGASDTYFGSTGGVFNSIVLELDTTSANVPVFQYWNGAWVTLTLSNKNDTAAQLGAAGTVIFNWKPPADWVTSAPGALPTAYWIRQTANVGTIQHAGPNDPYTVTWPFIQIASNQLPGDIPALARMLLRPVGSDGTNNASGAADKIIYGVRSLSRGQAFRSHINMADTGNISGIEISQAPGAFISDNQAPTGRLVSWTATTSFANVGAVFVNGAISRDYAGRFRCFIRFSYDINTANTLTWIFRTQYGTDGSFFDSRPVVIDDTYEGSTPLTNPYLLEFNPIQIRSDLLVGNDTDIAELIFYPFVKTDTGTAFIRLHDIVLIPTDEFSGEVERIAQSGLQANALDLIDLDGTNQKLYSRAVKRNVADNRIKELWLSRGVLPPSLQANETQRVFFLQRSSATNNPEQSVSWQTLGVKLGKVSRYLGFRGDR